MKKLKKILSFALIFSLTMTQLMACSKTSVEPAEEKIHFQYAEKIVSVAEDFVTQFPFRKAGSAEAAQAGAWIAQKLQNMGYEVQESKGNLLIKKEGLGFERTEAQAKDAQGQVDEHLAIGKFRKTVLVMTAYDTSLGIENKTETPDFQGIAETGASVATLLQLAENIKNQKLGYDVRMVFLANSQNQISARELLAELSAEEKEQLEVVVDIGKIYAGSKLYIHAGQTSTQEGQKYLARRPLYQFVDLFANANFVYQYGVNLFTVQNHFDVKVPLTNQMSLYREFSLEKGNAFVFDEAGIPLVFFDSANYRLESLEDFKENSANFFEATQGKISGTSFDNLSLLKTQLPEKQLEIRVDMVARLIELYLQFGVLYASVNQ